MVVLAVLGIAIIGLKAGSFFLRHKIETSSRQQFLAMQAYYESGGDIAESTIRHAAGYCAEQDAGGSIPEAFREFTGDIFIFLLTDKTKDKSQEELMQEFLSRDRQRLTEQLQGMDAANSEEMQRMAAVVQKWKKDGVHSHVACVHRQLEGRGLIPAAQG